MLLLSLLLQWHSSGGVCENSTIEVCSREQGEKWLKTQNISKSLPSHASYINYPVRVFVNITYSMTCSEVTDCESAIELQVGLLNTTRMLMSQTDNNNIPDHIPGTASGTHHFYFNLNKGEDIFVLMLKSHSNDTCVNVSRILVYRHECPQQSIGLTRHLATPANINGNVPGIPQCADNSLFFALKEKLKLLCTSEGKWSNDVEYCQCNMEYFEDDDMCISKCELILTSYKICA